MLVYISDHDKLILVQYELVLFHGVLVHYEKLLKLEVVVRRHRVQYLFNVRLLGLILDLAALLIGSGFRCRVYLILFHPGLWYLLHVGGHVTHVVEGAGSVRIVLVLSMVSHTVLLVFDLTNELLFVRLLEVMLRRALLTER